MLRQAQFAYVRDRAERFKALVASCACRHDGKIILSRITLVVVVMACGLATAYASERADARQTAAPDGIFNSVPSAVSFAAARPSLSIDGSCKRFLVTPSAFLSALNGNQTQAGFTRPLLRGLRPSLPSQSNSLAKVLHLFFVRGPATILRAIVAVVVDSFDGMLPTRAWPHVGEEVNEAVVSQPAITNFNAATSVAFVLLGVRRCAAIAHRTPDLIFQAGTVLPRVAVAQVGMILAAQAAATANRSTAQPIPYLMTGVATIALAKPKSVVPFVAANTSHSNQSANAEAGHVLEIECGTGIDSSSHDVTFRVKVAHRLGHDRRANADHARIILPAFSAEKSLVGGVG